MKEKRAEYGKEIVATLSRQLTNDYGNNFNEKNLRRMIQFAEVFPDKEIVVSLIRQLSWTHFVALIPLKDDLQRDFYAEMCRIERWSVRTLRKKIDGMLYERTAISKKPEKLAKKELAALRDEDRLTPDLAANAIIRINEGFDSLRPRIEEVAFERAEELLLAHRRVRTAARLKGIRYRVEPHLPPDVLGIYVYLPVL